MNNILMKRVLRRMYQIREMRELIKLGENIGIEFDIDCGLCSNICGVFVSTGFDESVLKWMKGVFVSNDLGSMYPVSGGDMNPARAYNFLDLYTGEYGDRRWDLLDLLIKEAEKFINESI